jgi:phosphomannomutase
MTLDASVFKAYDVRGIVPDEIDADGVYRIVRAYVDEFEPKSMAIGRDMRLTSPELCAAAVRAALEAGCDVDEIGLVGTEMLYYAVCEHGYDGGLIVTASHNPKQYNGMKIVRRGALPLGGDGGIEKVRDRALAGEFRTPKAPGKHGQRDVLQGFAERCLSIVDVDDIAPLEVVLDGANGMAGTMMTPILERLPLRAERAHFDPDGTFPHYQPNPLLEENRQFIISEVTKRGADLGIAWDGDADRCFFIDDNGQFVPGDFITALIAESLLAKRPGETILYDLRASRAVPDTVERMGGKAIASRVGHAFIKHRMRKENALFAGEVSGHYYFRDFYSVDTGIVPALVVLELVSRSGKRISELLAPLHERYHLSGEINTTVSDVPLKLQELKERYGPGGEGGRVTHLDGVSVDFDDWHFNVRPSNTEPLLRLNLEAYSEAEMVRRRDEVLGLIRS